MKKNIKKLKRITEDPEEGGDSIHRIGPDVCDITYREVNKAAFQHDLEILCRHFKNAQRPSQKVDS